MRRSRLPIVLPLAALGGLLLAPLAVGVLFGTDVLQAVGLPLILITGVVGVFVFVYLYRRWQNSA